MKQRKEKKKEKEAKPQVLNRDEKARREARIKQALTGPINQFLNMTNDEGKLKYPVAERMRKYFIANPDPCMDSMRLANSLVHEIRWRKDQARRYLDDYESSNAVTMRDKFGQVLKKEECYTAHIKETQVVHIILSKLRNHLIQGVLATVEKDIFTLEQYDTYVGKVEEVVKSLGYELFPIGVEIIEPL